MAEFLALHDAVARHLKAGDTVAFEGFTHLIPHAAAHEAIRQGIGDLTLLRMTPDIIYDQMIGMGLARKVVFSYAGNPGVGQHVLQPRRPRAHAGGHLGHVGPRVDDEGQIELRDSSGPSHGVALLGRSPPGPPP